MSNGSEKPSSRWQSVIAETVELAEQFPERYRTEIFRTVLGYRLGNRPDGEAAPVVRSAVGAKLPQTGGLAAVAAAAEVPIEGLRRILEVEDESEQVRILVPRVGGTTISEQQNRFSAVYCFAREKGLGESKTSIEDLRTLCEDRGCYDSNNFTRNFRNQDLLREVPGDDGKDRKYLLSGEGVAKAKQILQSLIESEA